MTPVLTRDQLWNEYEREVCAHSGHYQGEGGNFYLNKAGTGEQALRSRPRHKHA